MKRMKLCRTGTVLLRIFLILTVCLVAAILPGYFGVYKRFGIGTLISDWRFWVPTTLIAILTASILFWIGIALVYTTSTQLGMRWRVWGVVCGWIPIANIIMLFKIIDVASDEVKVEMEKIRLNASRKDEKICATKYPILMVHGVFFRDFKLLNYWGRIPKELQTNGAKIYYGEHRSAAAVDDSAEELAARIRGIIASTGCEKVNVIAHSKGGLDMRTAIAKCGIGPMVASLTTINTPHRGCEFADYLLHKIPEKEQQVIAKAYNTAATELGDVDPDFLAAVYDLTHENCMKRNEVVPDDPGVYYQSYGSRLNKPFSGRFPLNFTYMIAHHFDGPNDGLVGEKSFPWGRKYEFLTTTGHRGISHGDMIDLNRENFDGFDVREFFVQLVADLKNRGF